jgi:PAS domain S-box-containing protein
MITLRRSRATPTHEDASDPPTAALLDALPAAAIWVDREGTVTGWAGLAEGLLGLRADEAIGASLTSLVVDPHDTLFVALREGLNGIATSETDTLLWRRDGSVVPVRVAVSPVRGGGGAASGVAIVLRDASELRGLGETLEYHQQVLESVGEAIVAVDEKLAITAWNRAAEEIYGWSAVEVLGRRVGDVLGTQLVDGDFGQAIRTLLEDGRFRGEVLQRTRAGSEVRAEIRAAAVRSERGGTAGFVMVSRDVTASRESERERDRLVVELRQSQKLEALGQLAAGVAHDFNNLLTAIHGFGELLVASLDDGRPRRDAAEVVQAAARGAALTRQLLAFGRQEEGSTTPIDLSALVAGLDSLLARTLAEQVRLVFALEEPLPAVLADRGQLEQVVLNLALNARDAMPGGGLLTISTDLVRADGLEPAGDGRPPAGGVVRLRVSDTGCGMSEEARGRAFEPFFTTKERGRGTGLGLATVWGIVGRAGGTVSIDSLPGGGTTVTVQLPVADEAVEETQERDAEAPAGGGRETVLVVEDEDAVRRLACRILSESGYTVLSAPDAQGALRVAALHVGPLDLLLTDVVLPGMSGRDLAQRLTELRPEARALAMSGYACGEFGDAGLPEGLPLIPKPFKHDVLLGRVRDALDGR